jgi:two-component system NtrC family sensor kinase
MNGLNLRIALLLAVLLVSAQLLATAVVLVLVLDASSAATVLGTLGAPLVMFGLLTTGVLTGIGVRRVARITVEPLARLVAAGAAQLDDDELLKTRQSDANELSRLSSTLHSMMLRIELDRRRLRETVSSLEHANAELKAAQSEMIEAEKLAAVGRLAAGLAHEVGNPLGIIQGYLELLDDEQSADRRLEFSAHARQELARIDTLLAKLRDVASQKPAAPQPVFVDEVLRELLVLPLLVKPAHINLLTDIGENLLVNGDPEALRQLFLNCLLNARDAVATGGAGVFGEISVRAGYEGADAGEPIVVVEIGDNGDGVDEAAAPHLFEPFFTTKPPGAGTGLGLYVCRLLVAAHGGAITLTNQPGGGAMARITLPAVERR